MAETGRKPLPPYMPYRTFITFLDHLRSVAIPSHIDKGAMSSMSGAMQSWMKAALRYMALIDSDDVPQPRLRKLVQAQGDERKAMMKELFKSSYSFLDGKIDLSNTTQPKLREAIQALGAQGETVEKVMAFLVAMAKDAGVPLSPYLTKRNPRRPRARGQQPLSRTPADGGGRRPTDRDEGGESGAAMKTIALPGANGQLTLSGTFNVFDLSGDERELVFTIIDKMKEFEAAHKEVIP
jgi:hypothetical protein